MNHGNNNESDLTSFWGDQGKLPEGVESKVQSGDHWKSLEPFQGAYKVKTVFLNFAKILFALVMCAMESRQGQLDVCFPNTVNASAVMRIPLSSANPEIYKNI